VSIDEEMTARIEADDPSVKTLMLTNILKVITNKKQVLPESFMPEAYTFLRAVESHFTHPKVSPALEQSEIFQLLISFSRLSYQISPAFCSLVEDKLIKLQYETRYPSKNSLGLSAMKDI
jgi:hypothetical protein